MIMDYLSRVDGASAPILTKASLVKSLFILAFLASVRLVAKRHNATKLPPSPRALWSFLLGHAAVAPSQFPWKVYGEWGKTLGNLFYMSILGRPVVILNSAEDAHDLLDKRGAFYSDRPSTFFYEQMIGMNYFMGFLRYGEQFRLQRRMMQQTFNSQAVKLLEKPLAQSVVRFLSRIIDDESSFPEEIARFVNSIIMEHTYGHDMSAHGEVKFQTLISEFNSIFHENATPGTHLLDFLPFMRYYPTWMPGGSWRKGVAKYSRQYSNLLDLPFQEVESKRVSIGLSSGLLPRLLDERESLGTVDDKEIEKHIKNVAVAAYIGASETTPTIADVFALMMLHHPEVTRRAQEEIDLVVGSGRLPGHDDRASLPYIDCILKEVLRYNPPAPLGMPHKSSGEDEYRGMRIPKNSTLVTNLWQMMHDPRYFERPGEFCPERFLDVVKRYDTPEQYLNSFRPDDPSSVVFGFGRRACPGRYFADVSLWLMIANTLAVFDFKPPLDPASGLELLPEIRFRDGHVSQLVPFKCRVVPRSRVHAKLVEDLTNALE